MEGQGSLKGQSQRAVTGLCRRLTPSMPHAFAASTSEEESGGRAMEGALVG